MPGYRVSPRARRDIREIGLYTQRRWGREQRRRYLTGLGERLARLAESPAISPERLDLHPPVRIHRYERHLIVYATDGNGILVIRVLHASMNVAARLSEG